MLLIFSPLLIQEGQNHFPGGSLVRSTQAFSRYMLVTVKILRKGGSPQKINEWVVLTHPNGTTQTDNHPHHRPPYSHKIPVDKYNTVSYLRQLRLRLRPRRHLRLQKGLLVWGVV